MFSDRERNNARRVSGCLATLQWEDIHTVAPFQTYKGRTWWSTFISNLQVVHDFNDTHYRRRHHVLLQAAQTLLRSIDSRINELNVNTRVFALEIATGLVRSSLAALKSRLDVAIRARTRCKRGSTGTEDFSNVSTAGEKTCLT